LDIIKSVHGGLETMSEEVNGVGLGLGRDNPAILKRRAFKLQGFKASPKLQAPSEKSGLKSTYAKGNTARLLLSKIYDDPRTDPSLPRTGKTKDNDRAENVTTTQDRFVQQDDHGRL
jgi:hypothetical protein